MNFKSRHHRLFPQLEYGSKAGFGHVVQTATNLPANGSSDIWSAVITNPGTGSRLSFSNYLAGPQQFFRTRVQLPQ